MGGRAAGWKICVMCVCVQPLMNTLCVLFIFLSPDVHASSLAVLPTQTLTLAVLSDVMSEPPRNCCADVLLHYQTKDDYGDCQEFKGL